MRVGAVQAAVGVGVDRVIFSLADAQVRILEQAHGHCGVMHDHGVDNDATLINLGKQAVAAAAAAAAGGGGEDAQGQDGCEDGTRFELHMNFNLWLGRDGRPRAKPVRTPPATA